MIFVILGVLVVLLIVGYCIISTKLSNLRYRAEQSVLKDTPISTSNINAAISGGRDKKTVEKFLAENSMYTEQSIKERMNGIAMQIIQRVPNQELSEKVQSKMQKDSKLDKIQRMQLKRIDLAYYKEGQVGTYFTYTDNRDEYLFTLDCNLVGQSIIANKYGVTKGATVGF